MLQNHIFLQGPVAGIGLGLVFIQTVVHAYDRTVDLHVFPWGLPSHVTLGLCPYIPSLHLSKVWRPIVFSGWGCALIGYELGTPCFLCENPANEPIYVFSVCLKQLGLRWNRPMRIRASLPNSLNTDCCFFICLDRMLFFVRLIA